MLAGKLLVPHIAELAEQWVVIDANDDLNAHENIPVYLLERYFAFLILLLINPVQLGQLLEARKAPVEARQVVALAPYLIQHVRNRIVIDVLEAFRHHICVPPIMLHLGQPTRSVRHRIR